METFFFFQKCETLFFLTILRKIYSTQNLLRYFFSSKVLEKINPHILQKKKNLHFFKRNFFSNFVKKKKVSHFWKKKKSLTFFNGFTYGQKVDFYLFCQSKKIWLEFSIEIDRPIDFYRKSLSFSKLPKSTKTDKVTPIDSHFLNLFFTILWAKRSKNDGFSINPHLQALNEKKMKFSFFLRYLKF